MLPYEVLIAILGEHGLSGRDGGLKLARFEDNDSLLTKLDLNDLKDIVQAAA